MGTLIYARDVWEDSSPSILYLFTSFVLTLRGNWRCGASSGVGLESRSIETLTGCRDYPTMGAVGKNVGILG